VPMLEVSQLDLHYGQSQILYEVSLSAAKGQITAVIGNNGVGKTSLLKSIAGRHPASSAMMSVQENLETGFACLPKSEHHIPDDIFQLFPVLENMKARRGGDLSGGQQQQLAIARALVTKPKVLLLDEPTEGIQPNVIQQIGDTLRLLREKGDMAIILVEQNADFAFGLGDSFVVMEGGRVKRRSDKADYSKAMLLDDLAL